MRLILVFLFSTQLSFSQSFYKGTDSLFTVEDYWQEELAPMTDLNQMVMYIHNDPFKTYFLNSIPAGNPLEREINVNSFYGARNHPVHKVLKFHRGIDLAGKVGEYVVASGEGEVVATGFQEDLGYFVKIQHSYGFESIYGHLSKILTKKGDIVCRDQRIGKVGATGKVTGPHLHYTLKKNGEYIDPFDFLFMGFNEQ